VFWPPLGRLHRCSPRMVAGHHQCAVRCRCISCAVHGRLLAVESCGPVSQLHHPSGARRAGHRCHRLIVGSVDTRMASHVEGQKEDPRDIAQAGLDALNRGENLCDTDYMAIEARARYNRDPARYERQMAKLLRVDVQSTGR